MFLWVFLLFCLNIILQKYTNKTIWIFTPFQDLSPLKQKLGKKLLKIVVNILKVFLTLGVCPASSPEVFPLTSEVTGVTSMQRCSTLQPLTQCGTGVLRCHGTTALMLNSMALLFPVFRQKKKTNSWAFFFLLHSFFCHLLSLTISLEGLTSARTSTRRGSLQLFLGWKD